eukprot:309339-Chlamydomonas_euryale.AAC.2
MAYATAGPRRPPHGRVAGRVCRRFIVKHKAAIQKPRHACMCEHSGSAGTSLSTCSHAWSSTLLAALPGSLARPGPCNDLACARTSQETCLEHLRRAYCKRNAPA